MWRVWILGFCFLAACTKPNPGAVCGTGTCIDPTYPFCDVDGSVGGTPGTCIAVTCTPGAFGSCRGTDIALTCNAAGTSYDAIQCPLGCDPTLSGCRLCEPNQTVCTNGQLATCDAAGTQTAVDCPLGCFENQPRCRDIEPSNHLVTYLDMVQHPVDLDLSGTQFFIDTSTGTIKDGVNNPISAVSFLAPDPLGGPPIRTFVVNDLKLGDLSVYSSSTSTALAFLASGDVTISKTIYLASSVGGIEAGPCVAPPGFSTHAQANGAVFYIGGGGGGGAGVGGSGAVVIDQNAGTPPTGGGSYGSDDLQPLVGGCAGAGFNNTDFADQSFPDSGNGGGAIQISSRRSITVVGSIAADGTPGGFSGNFPGGGTSGGGGAGGGILLEAPRVVLAPAGKLTAHGGHGAGCSPATQTCGAPGAGGTGTSAATAGGAIVFVTALGPSTEFFAGTGGGSVGRIRVNTPAGNYTIDSTATQDALVTTGLLKTR